MPKLTKHAEQRFNQRGIRINDVGLILQYGKFVGAGEYIITDTAKRVAIRFCKKKMALLERERPNGWGESIRQLKKVIQRFDKLSGKMVVIKGEKIITAYHMRSKKTKKHLRFGRRKGHFR